MRILVGMMHCGENEYRAARESLDRQSVAHELFVIEHLPNREAHRALYRTFMDRAAGFDALVKMDADMVFREADGLARMKAALDAKPGVGALCIDVFDWLSGVTIPGQYIFAPTTRWTEDDDPIRVDRPGSGRHHRIHDPDPPITDHMPDPTPFQAFATGLHRGLKAVVPRRAYRKVGDHVGHFMQIHHAWLRWRAIGDARRLYAVAGFDMAINSDPALFVDYRGERARRAFAELVEPLGEAALAARLAPLWDSPVTNAVRWAQRLEQVTRTADTPPPHAPA